MKISKIKSTPKSMTKNKIFSHLNVSFLYMAILAPKRIIMSVLIKECLRKRQNLRLMKTNQNRHVKRTNNFQKSIVQIKIPNISKRKQVHTKTVQTNLYQISVHQMDMVYSNLNKNKKKKQLYLCKQKWCQMLMKKP